MAAASYEESPPDEGYSEDPLTLGVSANLPQWLSTMSPTEQTDYVMSIIAHLPTSHVAEIVRRLRPRLYINFIKYLPPEVCLKILGFLDPVSLINTARSSRAWMLLSMDRKLWEQLYLMEGFRVIDSEVQRFESSLNIDRSRPSEGSSDEHASKRRATPQRILPSLQTDGDSEMTDVDFSGSKQASIFGGQLTREPVNLSSDADVPMLSPQATSPSRSIQFPRKSSNASQGRLNRRASSGSTLSSNASPVSNISSLVVVERGDGKKKLNWQYLYSQRRRLEANWEAEKYTNFQLPHPHHPEEAHNECIYTIQHAGKYLVSGSRDRTLRIWDLDTRRLVRAPLRAHTGSVLCLQFDADPEEDLIVSGSSDSTVVLWKFSTGQVIQRLRKAHRESVLNVRFDKRVLVTCSKDKTIKVFNRRALNAGDVGYPVESFGVNPVPTYLNNYGFNPAPTAGLPIKPPYSIIACLEGHGAAVNAVQIHGDEIVSASGDRTVKVWNWPEQTCVRTLIGHSKGIACVQYDGRRIVSGSSDNEVKVFDKESGLEVASLRAHSNLVRTVQAGFGDLPYSVEEDKENAKAIDHDYFRAVDSGAVSRNILTARGRPRNAGSRRPEDITAYGAKLPPGGGGGRFGRIVSGSYDETIIIWRRDKEGVWKAQHTLRQEDAAHAAARAPAPESRTRSERTISPTAPPTVDQSANDTEPSAPTQPFAPGSDTFYRHLIDTAIQQGPNSLRQAIQTHPHILDLEYLSQQLMRVPTARRQLMNSVVNTSAAAISGQTPNSNQAGPSQAPPAPAQIQPQTQPQVQEPSTPSTTSLTLANTLAHIPNPTPATQTTVLAATNAPPNVSPLPTFAPPPALNIAAAQPVPAGHGTHHHLPANMLRVFKLQFDARRIICCSQTSTIVGWDFANGDEQIIEASRFFAPIE